MKKFLLIIAVILISIPTLRAQDITVTLNFISPDIEGSIYDKVITSSEAFSGEFYEDVVIDSDVCSFKCKPTIGFNFEPRDGYKLYSFKSNISDTEYQNLFFGKYQSSVTILPGAPEDVSLYIEVVEEGYSSVKSLNYAVAPGAVFNLLGVKIMDAKTADDLNSLHPGIYIINGKKHIIK